jgi:hypothetical protein
MRKPSLRRSTYVRTKEPLDKAGVTPSRAGVVCRED